MALNCIKSVCDQAAAVKTTLSSAEKDFQDWRVDQQNLFYRTRQLIEAYLAIMAANGAVFDCVINGPDDTYCYTDKTVHLTVAEALSRLNALGIAGVTKQGFTATADQTDFTLASAPINPAAVEVVLNGSEQDDPRDYQVIGTTLQFTYPLAAGDEIEVREFTV